MYSPCNGGDEEGIFIYVDRATGDPQQRSPLFLKVLNTTRMILIDYLKDTKAEMRHVTWPTRQQAISYTLIVLAISIGTGLFLGLLDFGFAKIIARFI